MNRRLVLLALLGLPVLACHLILGIDDHDFQTAEADAAVAPDAFVPDPCVHQGPPGKPADKDDPIDLELTFAIHDSTVATKLDGGALAGFDLDGRCTCDKSPGARGEPSCVAPKESTVACDLERGIDNAGGQVFDDLNARSAVILGGRRFENVANEAVRCGQNTVLLNLTKYNGKGDDNSVSLVSAQSAGIRKAHADEPDAGLAPCSPVVGSSFFPAKFDATDEWSLPASALFMGAIDANKAVLAYVKDFHLVVDRRGERSQIQTSLGATTLTFSTPVLTARLVPLDEAYRELKTMNGAVVGTAKHWKLTDGQISGRVPTADLLGALGSVDISGGKPRAPERYLCNSPFYDVLKSAICAAADSVLFNDNDASDACNAVSMAAQFEGAPASYSTTPVELPDTTTTVCGQKRFGDACGNPYVPMPTPCPDGGGGC